MARSFPSGAVTDNVKVAQQAAINGLAPFSMSCWYNLVAFGGEFYDKSVGAHTGHSLVFTGNTRTISFRATAWLTTFGQWITGSLPLAGSTGVWHHLAITYAYALTTDQPIIYVDGVSISLTENSTPSGGKATDTASLFIGNANALTLGMDGSMAEFAMWNTILTQAEISALAAGANPQNIERASLAFYMPLCGVNSPEPDLINENNGVVTGTTVTTGPPNAQSPCNPVFAFDDEIAEPQAVLRAPADSVTVFS